MILKRIRTAFAISVLSVILSINTANAADSIEVVETKDTSCVIKYNGQIIGIEKDVHSSCQTRFNGWLKKNRTKLASK